MVSILLGKEGVSQGDPLSMMLYAVAVHPLIDSLTIGFRICMLMIQLVLLMWLSNMIG